MDAYYEHAILLTGLTGLIAMFPCLWFYSRDRAARKIGGLVSAQKPWKLNGAEMVLFLGMGAGFSQFANMLVGILQSLLNYEAYQESMDQMMSGKQMWFLILCMGIIAPLAEEIVFRWLIYLRLRDYMRMGTAAVISGLIFGIYHGNLVQAVYAGILGMVFAYFLDISGCLWSSVLLHMGANIWSLISPDLYTWMIDKNPTSVMMLLLILLAVIIFGYSYFTKRVQGRIKRVL
ncbi:CPBP family intramembrane glutamic endopeptidase [Blautia sp. MSJ-19]|uniref:CPBP family intramembrane glutamic endopeptidase n=1 Tax=Blautia sp. MSJ-19 TaxID=2841517 RepID=UPI00209DC948|nr:CPBP family intramembrane glutamic endopeptidase [Blautia sp. MSJ-19]